MFKSVQAITRHILETNKIDAAKVIHIRKAIAHGMEKGILKQARTSGKGAGSFRVAKEEKPKKATKPKKPVAKKVVKASSPGASTVKNLQKKTVKKVAAKKVVKKTGAKTQEKKTTKPTKKPSAAKKDERPCKKPSAEEEQVEPAAVETVLNEAEAGVKATRNPLAQLMDLKVRVADRLNEMEKTLESNNPLSTTEMRAMINDLDDAWFEFVDQYDRLLIISGRGRLFGL